MCSADHDYHDGNARRGELRGAAATRRPIAHRRKIVSSAAADVTDTLIMELHREFQREREREILFEPKFREFADILLLPDSRPKILRISRLPFFENFFDVSPNFAYEKGKGSGLEFNFNVNHSVKLQ